MTVRKTLGRLLILLLAIFAVTVWYNRVALVAFPGIISAYTAKEYCSCRYVMQASADYCQGYVKQYVPSRVMEDEATRQVTAEGLGRASTAAWQGERLGCRLLSSPP
jgi:hypothetical protein